MTSPNDDIRSLIDADAESVNTPKTAPQPSVTPASAALGRTGNDDLQTLIAQTNAAATAAPAGAPRSAPRSPKVRGDLERALQGAHAGGVANRHASAPAARHHAAVTPAEDLEDAVQQIHAADPAGSQAAASAVTRARVLATTLVLGLALGAVWMWKEAKPALAGHPATLQQLAQSVEQYRHARNGSLPEQLSNLEHFPKDVVEWQLKHWRARDAAGRTEIMWAPNGPQHYRIVLRHGTEVWVYNDIDGQSKQTHK